MTVTVDEILSKIELRLNMINGAAFTPEDRLGFLLERISNMSHVANYVECHYRPLLNELVDYLEVIEIDFSKFEDDPEAYEQGWKEWKEKYYSRPGLHTSRENYR